MAYFLDGPRQRGSAYEAVQEFERELNRTLGTKTLQVECIFIPVPRDELLSRLANGRGDLAVGAIRTTPERRARLDFSTPLYEGVRDIVVTGPGAPPLQRLDDLSGQEGYVRPSSSAAESLRRLNQQWRAAGRPEIVIEPADEHLDDGDILEMVGSGIVPMTVVSDGDASAYAPLLPGLAVRRDLEVASGGSYAWALRRNTPQLREAVDRFVRGHRSGTTFGNIMIQRYWQNNRWLRNPTAGAGLARYQAVIGAFQAASAEFDLDPLLLLAQGYQESGLEQNRKTHAGAVGVMQIKPSPAAGPPIGIPDVNRLENNVRAGAKYLRFIIDRYYSDSTITPLDRELFAMASYNAGPARVAPPAGCPGGRPRSRPLVPERGGYRRPGDRSRDRGLREQHLQVLPRVHAAGPASRSPAAGGVGRSGEREVACWCRGPGGGRLSRHEPCSQDGGRT